MKILFIADESDLQTKLCQLLDQLCCAVDTSANGEDALNKMKKTSFDLILIHVEIEDMTMLKELRQKGVFTPVLLLSVVNDSVQATEGTNLGGNFIAKPLAVTDLVRKVKALFGQTSTRNPTIVAGNIQLNPTSREVFNNGKPVKLTSREFSLLEFLLQNRGKVISRLRIAEHVWGDEFDPLSLSNYIDVHMSNLRKKVSNGEKDKLIKTVRGFGYRIDGEKF